MNESEIDFQSRIMADERSELQEGRNYREYEEWLSSLEPSLEELNNILDDMYKKSG